MLSGPTLGKVFVGLIGVFFIYFYFKCLILCLRACCDNGEDEDLTTVRITISERRRQRQRQQQPQQQQQQPQQPQSPLSADCNIEEELPSRTEELLRKFKFETVTEKHKYVKNAAAATRRIRNDDDDKNNTEKEDEEEEDVGDDGSIIHAQQQQDSNRSNPSTCYLKHMLSNWGRYPSSNHGTDAAAATATTTTECCSICLESYRPGDTICASAITTSCDHVFHQECIFEWLQTGNHNECPLCRTDLINTTTTTTSSS